MREIKFRAWDPETRVMTYEQERLAIVFRVINGKPYTWHTGDVFGNGPVIAESYCEIMQYTGLHDKNGKEIYEGDWWRIETGGMTDSKGFHPHYHEGEVHWEGINLAVGDLLIHNNEHIFGDGIGEVIGNIYENPELLK